MKHAYLILFHNQQDVTNRLISAIDDSRNDIYIHVDRKVLQQPVFRVQRAHLYFVENRIDVRWGDVSVVEAELELMKAALQQRENYAYLHLISGVDMPLKSQDFIHSFFEQHKGKEFIGFSQYDYRREVERKVQRYHLFAKAFRWEPTFSGFIKRSLRYVAIKFQELLNLKRNGHIEFKKGTQWVSITPSFASFLVDKEEDIKTIYRNTFCADEIYKQTLCWHSPFREKVYNPEAEALGCMRMIGWEDGQLRDWEEKDYERLIHSNFLFARKFNGDHIKVVNDILTHITNGQSFV